MAAALRSIVSRSLISNLKTVFYNYENVLTKQPCLILTIQPVRYITSFFNKVTGDQLWKGVTSVSNAGLKKGRGRGINRKRAIDLNRGQALGDGKLNYMWPGLNTPILRERQLVERHQLPPDPEKEARILRLRKGHLQFRRPSIPPLERGWSGAKMHGRRIGPPDPTGICEFEGYDSIILEFKGLSFASKRFSKNRIFSSFVATGNGNGMAGFSLAKSPLGRSALAMARNKCGRQLEFFERFEDRTVFHDIFVKVDRTKIWIRRRAAGYGLKCHRVIKALCELIGIKDLCCKVDGPKNVQKITQGFFEALRKQETHQNLANRTGLYVVELSENRDNFPRVLATPETPIRKDMDKEEPYDLNIIYGEGKLEKYKPVRPPFFANHPWHIKRTFDKLMFRNRDAFLISHRVENE